MSSANTGRFQKPGSTLAKLPAVSGLAVLFLTLAPTARAQVQETVLFDFPTPSADGAYPEAQLLADTTGPAGALRGLYGTGQYVFKLEPPAGGSTSWTERVLWKHTSEKAGFEMSYGTLLATTKRVTPNTDLFGTTVVGGLVNPACYTISDRTCGTVFSVMGHKHTKIYSFTGGADGFNPYYGPVADKSGNLYVTASLGGAAGCGTIIKLSPPITGQKKWHEETIWSFTGGNDGCSPNALITDSRGALYGTTSGGGDPNCGCGNVFALIPPEPNETAWTEKTLWNFQGGSDGANPFGALTAGKGGALYGATFDGGSANQGVAFSVTPEHKTKTGWTEAVIWTFTGNEDGGGPLGDLIFDKAGVLFGTTYSGGNATGDGTVFKLSPPTGGLGTWAETTLWQFSGPDGSEPFAGLTPDTSGVLYGITNIGGSINDGTVFSLQNTGFMP